MGECFLLTIPKVYLVIGLIVMLIAIVIDENIRSRSVYPIESSMRILFAILLGWPGVLYFAVKYKHYFKDL